MIKKYPTHKQLKREFNLKVKEAQDNCKHKKFKWFEHCWAIGHHSGYAVKICLRCNKELAQRPTKEEREEEELNRQKIYFRKNMKNLKQTLTKKQFDNMKQRYDK